jgi:hypothetical protein
VYRRGIASYARGVVNRDDGVVRGLQVAADEAIGRLLAGN